MDRISVGAKFFAPVQTGHGIHSASYTMATGSFPRVKRPGRSVDHPPPNLSQGWRKSRAIIYSPSESSWPVLWWTIPFTWRSSRQYVRWSRFKSFLIAFIFRTSRKWNLSTTARRFIAIPSARVRLILYYELLWCVTVKRGSKKDVQNFGNEASLYIVTLKANKEMWEDYEMDIRDTDYSDVYRSEVVQGADVRDILNIYNVIYNVNTLVNSAIRQVLWLVVLWGFNTRVAWLAYFHQLIWMSSTFTVLASSDTG